MMGLARCVSGSLNRATLTARSGLTAMGVQAAAAAPSMACQRDARRNYKHWWRVLPEDFELNTESMPKDMKKLLATDPRKTEMTFLDAYWYWRIRSEATILDPENLPKKNYKQLCRDMGLTVMNEPAEHMLGIIELYEYLKSSPFVGPFGTIENPVLVPAIHTERIVGCVGGTGDQEHHPLWFRAREGFLYRCGECDQIFMLVRVLYEIPEEAKVNPPDPDMIDTFDPQLLEKAHEVWNSGGMALWSEGYDAIHNTQLGGRPRPEGDQRMIGD